VLTRLVDVESDQAELLARILNAPLVSMEQMASGGARWPTDAKGHRPRYAIQGPDTPSSDDGQTALDL
jgi:hypothetical protein